MNNIVHLISFLSGLGFPPPVLFIQPRGRSFVTPTPGTPGSGFAYWQSGSKTIGLQWLTGYVQSDCLFL